MAMQQRLTQFDFPGPGNGDSRQTVTVFDVGMGLDFDVSPTNLKPGSTVSADNWVMREGGMCPRPGTTLLGDTPNLAGATIRGGMDVVTSEASHFQTVSGSTQFAFLDPLTNLWSNVSWVPGSVPAARPPNPSTSYWHWTQSVRSDGSIVAFMAPTASGASGGCIQCWVPGTTTFSAVTGIIPAKAIASFDNYLMAWSTGTFSGATYIPYQTRIQWSDRGDPLNFVAGSGSLAGFEDLLTARGAGTGIAVLNDRVILFTDQEIWEGVPANVPGFAQFFFGPRDRSVGCRVPQTIQTVPEGVLFVGNDSYLYLLPKDGGVAQVVDKRLAQVLRNTGASWAVYNTSEHRYELYTGVVGQPYSPTPPGPATAEINNVSVVTFAGSTSVLSWSNVSFNGDETIEVWLANAGTWDTVPYQQVAFNGLASQQVTLVGLSPGNVYTAGFRARTAAGVYVTGYDTPTPASWVPSDPGTINPFSSNWTTLGTPGQPLDFASTLSDYSVGPKNYQEIRLTWSNTIGIPGANTQVLRDAVSPPVTVIGTVPFATTHFEDQQLLTPAAPEATYYYAVRHVDSSGVIGAMSSVITYVNNGVA